MSDLKVYVNDLPEWWVAKDKQHLKEVMFGSGMDALTCDDEFDPDYWDEVPADQPLKIYEDVDDPATAVTKTAAEWAAESGPGFLCSKDY
jgi:hypothetical protein